MSGWPGSPTPRSCSESRPGSVSWIRLASCAATPTGFSARCSRAVTTRGDSSPGSCRTSQRQTARWPACTCSRSTRPSRRSGGASRCWRARLSGAHEIGGSMAVTFPTDRDIPRRARLQPMPDIAARMGIGPHLLEPYGHDVAKIKLDALDELKDHPKAKYVVVSAITPTPLGEGKTTPTVGLGDALGHIGKRAIVAIRQPSMGPTFGI